MGPRLNWSTVHHRPKQLRPQGPSRFACPTQLQSQHGYAGEHGGNQTCHRHTSDAGATALTTAAAAAAAASVVAWRAIAAARAGAIAATRVAGVVAARGLANNLIGNIYIGACAETARVFCGALLVGFVARFAEAAGNVVEEIFVAADAPDVGLFAARDVGAGREFGDAFGLK
jgi:hypothetical protein